jgi:transposase
MRLKDEVGRLRTENAALQADNRDLYAQVGHLQEQLAAALARITDLEQQRRDPPSFIKPNTPKPTEPKPPRKKRARQHNRARKRVTPTRIVEHALDRCPDCHYLLRGHSLDYSRQVLELPPPPPIEVIEHRVIKRFCPKCTRWRSPKLDLRGQVLGRSRIGVRLASVLAYLRTTLRLPIAAIRRYLTSLHQLRLSAGAIVEILHDVRQAAQPALDALKQQARRARILHGDETSWRENGQSGYIWSFSTPGEDAVRYYEYDASRTQMVVKRFLNGQFAGHLVSDFYCGYNDYTGKHQRCWAHLLRDLHALKEAHSQDAEVVGWAQAVMATYNAAQAWLAVHAHAPPPEREAQYVSLTGQTHALGLRYARSKAQACQALAKRLLRHEDELFQFVLIEGLSADNNLAERAIRPLVVIRKVSGGSRSGAGTKTRMALASLFHTWQARGENPFLSCLSLLSQPTASSV